MPQLHADQAEADLGQGLGGHDAEAEARAAQRRHHMAEEEAEAIGQREEGQDAGRQDAGLPLVADADAASATGAMAARPMKAGITIRLSRRWAVISPRFTRSRSSWMREKSGTTTRSALPATKSVTMETQALGDAVIAHLGGAEIEAQQQPVGLAAEDAEQIGRQHIEAEAEEIGEMAPGEGEARPPGDDGPEDRPPPRPG